jgi:tetratricopeptide (TPR) repeat protein
MQKNNVLFGIVGLIVGLVIGFFVANSINRNAISETEVASTSPDTTSVLDHGVKDAPVTQPKGALADVQTKLDKANNEPTNFAAQMQAGDMYSQIEKFDEAIKFYEKGVALNPNNLQANLVLANALFDLKQFENAEKYYTKALMIDPKNIDARTDLGTTLVERANPDFERAVKEFQKSLEADPKHEPTLYNLAVVYARKGDAENAQKMLAQLESVNPASQYVGKLKQTLAPKQ